jgi:hypothetical protein
MKLLDICLKTAYFQSSSSSALQPGVGFGLHAYFLYEDKFYQQKEGMAIGSSLSLMISNIFMEHFEEVALDTADHKPTKRHRYVDSTFEVWPHGPA